MKMNEKAMIDLIPIIQFQERINIPLKRKL